MSIRTGALLQIASFLYTLSQAFLIPFLFELEVYGSYVIALSTSYVLAAILEPIFQKDLIGSYEIKILDYIKARFSFIIIILIMLFLFTFVSFKFDFNIYLIMSLCAGVSYFLNVLLSSFAYRERWFSFLTICTYVKFIVFSFSLLIIYYMNEKDLFVFLFVFFLCNFISNLMILYKLIRIGNNSCEINGELSSISDVLKSSFTWRGPSLYFNSLYIWFLPFSIDAQAVGSIKLLFSTIAASKFTYPINAPMFLTLMRSENIKIAVKHLLLTFIWFSFISAIFVFFVVPNLDYVGMFDDEIFYQKNIIILFPLYLCLPYINSFFSKVRKGLVLSVSFFSMFLLYGMTLVTNDIVFSLITSLVVYYFAFLLIFLRFKNELYNSL